MSGLISRLWSSSTGSADDDAGREFDTTIDELWIFPVKSCRGIKVQQAKVLPRGLEYDREFVIVEESTHRFLTARTIPKMILIETSIDFERQELTITIPMTILNNDQDGIQHVPDSTHTVSLKRPTQDQEGAGNHLNDVSIWRDTALDGFIVGSKQLTDDLSTFMGRRVLLIQKGFESRLAGLEGFIPSLPEAKFDYPQHPEVSWADEYPVLMISKASLYELDNRVKTEDDIVNENSSRFNTDRWRSSNSKGIESHRFRANVVLSATKGLAPWDEDSWAEIQISESETKANWMVVQRCGRCPLPSVDPDTAIRDPVVPDMFMKRDRFVAPSMPKKLCFGVQCCPRNEIAQIRVGDKIKVVRRFNDKRANGTPIRAEDVEHETE
ncbi:hypothetical protein OIO90_004658 [Microbotryomycetes sp. JL221]|nr:hypothetical protein OIO90_004658 [Microbotryomycetes sp. JL221]